MKVGLPAWCMPLDTANMQQGKGERMGLMTVAMSATVSPEYSNREAV